MRETNYTQVKTEYYNYNSHKKAEYFFAKGSPSNGFCIEYYCNGKKKMEYDYKNNKKFGLVVGYHFTNSKIESECNYKNGKEHGECVLYHDNGNIMQEYFMINGKCNGVVKNYFYDGVLESEYIYRDDIHKHTTKYYYENSRNRYRASFNETDTTKYCIYHKNGYNKKCHKNKKLFFY